jgi:hypothetical protein
MALVTAFSLQNLRLSTTTMEHLPPQRLLTWSYILASLSIKFCLWSRNTSSTLAQPSLGLWTLPSPLLHQCFQLTTTASSWLPLKTQPILLLLRSQTSRVRSAPSQKLRQALLLRFAASTLDAGGTTQIGTTSLPFSTSPSLKWDRATILPISI